MLNVLPSTKQMLHLKKRIALFTDSITKWMCTVQDVIHNFPEFGWRQLPEGNFRPFLLLDKKKQNRHLCLVLIWEFSTLFSKSPVILSLRHALNLFLSFPFLFNFHFSVIFTQNSWQLWRLPAKVGQKSGLEDNKMREEPVVRTPPWKRQKLMCTFASSQISLQLMIPANREINKRLQTALGIKR